MASARLLIYADCVDIPFLGTVYRPKEICPSDWIDMFEKTDEIQEAYTEGIQEGKRSVTFEDDVNMGYY